MAERSEAEVGTPENPFPAHYGADLPATYINQFFASTAYGTVRLVLAEVMYDSEAFLPRIAVVMTRDRAYELAGLLTRLLANTETPTAPMPPLAGKDGD